MYYDARPSAFNGMFDFYSLKPLKGYYPFYMFSKLYELNNEVYSSTGSDNFFVTASSDGKRHAAMVVNYSVDKNILPQKAEILLQGCETNNFRYYFLDEYNTMKETAFPSDGCITMQSDSVLLITNYHIN